MFWELLVILVLLLANGLFAMAEIALVSARSAKLQSLAEEGDERARLALALLREPNRFLSTVQVGITLVSILAGAFGGATLAESLAAFLGRWPALEQAAGPLSLVVVVGGITFVSVIIGELVPKRLALANPEAIALRTVRFLNLLSRTASPLVHFMSFCTDGILQLFGMEKSAASGVSEEEVRILIDQGLSAGVFDKQEKQMVENVLSLDEERVADVMTPRTRIVWLSLEDPDEVNWRRIVASGHSHFPVFQGSRDNAVGLVSVKHLAANLSLAGKAELRSLLTKPLFVPELMPVRKLLENFKRTGLHVALVTDEFGSVTGLVTLIDVLEAIVGDVPSADERTAPDFVVREDGSILVDALTHIDDVESHLALPFSLGSDDESYRTLSGFLMYHLGRVPQEGDVVVRHDYRFEVIDMDRQRIDKVLITPPRTESPQPNPDRTESGPESS